MAAEGRELGWEDSIKQDAQDYEPIPEGDYNVTIEKFDRSRSKGEGMLWRTVSGRQRRRCQKPKR